MKFGSRQICNVVFRATQSTQIGKAKFNKGQPVFYLDTAKTSTLEGAATTVYATGGRGNTRLIAWEGEKTLTFTVEDALLSPISFAMLSGAGVVKGNEGEEVHFHQTTMATADADTGIIDLTNALEPNERIDDTAPLFVMKVDEAGDLTGELITGTFSIVKDATDDSINGKQLTFSNDVNLETTYTTFNGGKDAYLFPYLINEQQQATREEIEGWERNINPENAPDPTTDAILSQYIPASYVVNGKTVELVTKNSRGSYVVNEGIWTVTNSDDGSTVTLPMPKAMRVPTFTKAELTAFGITGLDDVTYTISNIKKTTDSEPDWASLTGDGTTAVTLWDGTLNSPTYGLKKKFYNSVVVSSSQEGSMKYALELSKSTSGKIYIELTPAARNFVLQKYFGLDLDNSTILSTARAPYDTSFEKAYAASKAIKARAELLKAGTFMVDYYVVKPSASVTELQIDAETFGGYYYVEADTLFRRQSDGKDLPANITLPNVKIQSNFTFSMAATGDPSTFTFTMDAFPGYTYFDKTKKVLCAIQIVDDRTDKSKTRKSVFTHKAQGDIEASMYDSSPNVYNEEEHGTWDVGN